MPDERYFPAVPNEDIESFHDDVRSGVVGSGDDSPKGANPVDDALAKELRGIVPEDWAAKTNIEDLDAAHSITTLVFKIDIFRRYGLSDHAERLEKILVKKFKLMDSVDAKMLNGILKTLQSFGDGNRGPGQESASGPRAWIVDDMTRDDDG